jgi:hypothetical protein
VDVDVGGLVDESAGLPVRIQGRIVGISQASQRAQGHTWFHIGFGDSNVLIVSPYLAQIMEPSTFTDLGIDLADFEVFAIKSRVHFRRGFDDSGFARTILLVEPDQPFLGTVRLDGLPYQHVDLKAFYPQRQPRVSGCVMPARLVGCHGGAGARPPGHQSGGVINTVALARLGASGDRAVRPPRIRIGSLASISIWAIHCDRVSSPPAAETYAEAARISTPEEGTPNDPGRRRHHG